MIRGFANGLGLFPERCEELFRLIEKSPLLAGALMASLFVIPFAPLIALGEDAYVRLWDEASFNVMRVILANSGKVFADSLDVVPNLMGGLPRLSYESEFKLPILLYYLLPPFPAYVVDNVLVRAVAFFGMYLLVRDYILPERPFYAKLCAVTYAALPFFVLGGIGVAGQPLLVYSALRFRERGWSFASARYVLPFLLFPFYSLITADGLYLLLAGGIVFLALCLVNRKVEHRLLGLLGLMAAAYVVADYRWILVGLGLVPFEHHRVEFGPHRVGIYDLVTMFLDLLRDGYDTARTNFWPGGAAAVFLYAGSCALFGWRIDRRLLAALIGLVGLAAIPAFIGYGLWLRYRHLFPGVLATTDIARLYQILPSLAYVALFLAVAGLVRLGHRLGEESGAFGATSAAPSDRIGGAPAFASSLPRIARFYSLLPALLLAIQFFQNCFSGPQYLPYLKPGYAREIFLHAKYASFVERELFRQVKEHIGRDQSTYRVASFGLEPEIAALGGFYTVDGYALLYPYEYKKRFRPVIAGELDRYPALRHYFDDFGGKVYLFSGELRAKASGSKYMVNKAWNVSIEHLAIDTAALRGLGAEYIISAVEIGNAASLRLRLEKVFDREGSLYRLFLYSVGSA